MQKFFTPKNLYKVLRERNGNVCFLGNTDLCQALDDCSASDRAYCMGELFFRWFVGGMCDEQIETAINAKLPEGALKDFRDFLDVWAKCYSKGKVFDRNWYNGTNDFALKCQTAIRTRFKELFDGTDGFIPVYSEIENRAFFIPFHIEDSLQNTVVDLAGNEISCWTNSLDLLELGEKIKIVLHCAKCQELIHARSFDDNTPEAANSETQEAFVGNSFLLPVYIGLLRRSNKLPRFAVWKLLSTGAFSIKHCLVSVETKEKVADFQKLFPNSLMLLPECCNSSNPLGDNIQILPLMHQKDLETSLRNFVETKAASMDEFAYMDYRYATKRVNAIIDLIRHKNQGNWEERIAQLDALLAPLDEWSNIDEYLAYQIAKAEAFCHCGNAPAALELNTEVEAVAKKHNCQEKMLHLAVDRLVNLTDTLAFEAIFRYANDLEQRLISFGDADLLMRFYGSMGQAYAYATLCARGDFSLKSKESFSNALENAAKLKNTPDFCMEMAQDKNYWHLWHVLFSPGTAEEERAFKTAWNHIECNLQNSEENRIKNMAYLMRQRAFAFYRYYLQTGEIIDFNPSEFEVTSQGEPWVKATTLKYIATLLTAKGEVDIAREIFEKALAVALPPYPIINFIRLTIVLQAAFSLRDDSLLSEAKEIVGELEQTEYMENACRWLDCVQQHKQPPALEYWY